MRGPRVFPTERARKLRRESPTAERIVWSRLRAHRLAGFKFVRQEPVGPYFADFACREAKLIVEIDGATHSSDAEIANDRRRTALLETMGYRVLRFSNAQVFENVAGLCEEIMRALALEVS